jgi:hypothetical protein
MKTQEARVRNITAAIAKSGFSEALGEQLSAEEETLRSSPSAARREESPRRPDCPAAGPGCGRQVP